MKTIQKNRIFFKAKYDFGFHFEFHFLILKLYFGLNKMLFFGIVFPLYFFQIVRKINYYSHHVSSSCFCCTGLRGCSYEVSFLFVCLFVCFLFFYQGFLSRTLTTHRTAGAGRGPSFIPLPPTHEHLDICLQLCM